MKKFTILIFLFAILICAGNATQPGQTHLKAAPTDIGWCTSDFSPMATVTAGNEAMLKADAFHMPIESHLSVAQCPSCHAVNMPDNAYSITEKWRSSQTTDSYNKPTSSATISQYEQELPSSKSFINRNELYGYSISKCLMNWRTKAIPTMYSCTIRLC